MHSRPVRRIDQMKLYLVWFKVAAPKTWYSGHGYILSRQALFTTREAAKDFLGKTRGLIEEVVPTLQPHEGWG
jgi:hypothetical protein